MAELGGVEEDNGSADSPAGLSLKFGYTAFVDSDSANSALQIIVKNQKAS